MRVPEGLRPEIITSWERSVERIAVEVSGAPLADLDDIRATWETTPLRTAVTRIEPQLRMAADDGGLIVAVTDPAARILWTCEGSVMRGHAERVNFVPGGRWDESSVGTNALDLALRLDDAATVYSAEQVAVAKFWAAEGGQRVLASAQHLHGGIGVDVEYPLYRYTRWAKLGELTLGGAGRHLARLGAEIRGG